MLDTIKKLFFDENIFVYGFCPLKNCTINKRYLLERTGIDGGFVAIFAIPYYTDDRFSKRNISAYAVPRDYHLYIKELCGRIVPKLKEKFPHVSFAMFADHSPIDERDCALKAGIGILGKNNLLITEKYSSYVFLGELFVSVDPNEDFFEEKKPEYCENCGLCLSSCPLNIGECDTCLSALTQKKGELTENEVKLLSKYGVWGCDICADVCPHTKKALRNGTIYTPIDFFKTNLTPILTEEIVENMSDEEFSKRAYSWRGRDTVLRNLRATKNKKSKEEI